MAELFRPTREHTRSPGAETSTLRLLVMGVAVSVAVLVFAALVVADNTRRVHMPLWLGGIVVLSYVVLVVLGAAAPWLPPSTLRAGAAVGVCCFFVALVLFAPASGVLTGRASGETLPWPLTAFGGIAVAAVVVGGARLGWAAIVAWVVLIAGYRMMLGGYSVIALANDAQALTTAATLCAIAAQAVRASRDLDATAARATIIAAEQGAAGGRLAARARVAAFVHDEVLAALRGAAANAPGTAEALRAQAQRASAIVDADRETSDWIAQLRVLAAEAGAEFEVRSSARPVELESLVADAIVGAARQAVHNSVRHAGTCDRTVQVDIGDRDLSIRVVDDGVGFARDSAVAGRMGITASIEGSMRDVAGGLALVTSRPGAGTTVELRWSDTGDRDEDPAGAALRRNSTFEHGGVIVAAALFVLTQTLVAAASALAGTNATPLLVLVGILVSAALTVPGLPRSGARCVAAVVVLGATVWGALLATPPPLDYGSAWFLPAAGFVLVAVALNARPVLAVSGLVVVLSMFVAVALVRGVDQVHLVSIVVRTATIVGLGTLLSVAIVRMRRATRAYARRSLRIAEQREWDAAARRELDDHAAALEELAGPLLARMAAGETLQAPDRAHARAIEGRLRDGYRAGRLLQDPLIEAAMRARTRGIDVVLLDDAGDAPIEHARVGEIAEWMTTRLDAAGERFVGRLLPPGRPFAAQIVVDGRAHTFGG